MKPTDVCQFPDEQTAFLELSRVVSYNAETGELRWQIRAGRRAAGAIAGTVDKHGYVNAAYKGKKYKGHRLAWLLHFGKWPTAEIDHIDREKTNNRIANLREASHVQNMRNKPSKLRDLPRGVKRGTSAWLASITIGGRPRHLGSFRTIEEAGAAYQAAARQLHGEFHYTLD